MKQILSVLFLSFYSIAALAEVVESAAKKECKREVQSLIHEANQAARYNVSFR